MSNGLFHTSARGAAALVALALAGVGLQTEAAAAGKPRARDLGVSFSGEPGPLNAITDVAGVEVGHVTLIEGTGKLKVGTGPVRTGVTAILPRGKEAPFNPVFAAWFPLNGNGEMTGTAWVEEGGLMYGPVMITNTHSVGVVRDAVVQWALKRYHFDPVEEDRWSEPVVAETWDGWLNDIYGFHVKAEHAFRALDSAAPGPVAEGTVGGGAGNICYYFKGGIGTASRRLQDSGTGYTVGVLVQANGGAREQLMIAGVPVGLEITEKPAYVEEPTAPPGNSFIIVVATDAPLLPHQLKRIARRVSMGVARTGTAANNSSGDIFIAFSTANSESGDREGLPALRMFPNERLTPLFEATVEATEEAIVNALVAAESMTGVNDHFVWALPHDRLVELLKKYNRYGPPRP